MILIAEFALQVLIVEIGRISPAGASIFQTVPLTFGMWLTSVLIGAGSLGVAAAVKMTPKEYLEKIKIELPEDKVQEDENILSKAYSKVMGSMQRSETERLLE